MNNRMLQTIIFVLIASSYAHALHENISNTQQLRELISVNGVRTHQKSLYDIALAHEGTRMASTPGYEASVAYVKERAQAAGYDVRLQEFSIYLTRNVGEPLFEKINPNRQQFISGTDFSNMSGPGSLELSGRIEAVDLMVPSPSPSSSTSGCEAADFSSFTRGHIALLQRGTCTFKQKVENAIAAGAVGVIIFNEGNPGRTAAIASNLDLEKPIVVIGASFALGDSLRTGVLNGPTGTTVHVKSHIVRDEHKVNNVIAESKEGDPKRVVVVGAHLDSVHDGSGMNDNGSGSATILHIAESMAALKHTPKNKIRFIWFAAEEFGLLGSYHYVKALDQEDKNSILAMLNFDMLNSPNYARFIYDGDQSSFRGKNSMDVPSGSGFIEHIFLDYFGDLSMANHPTAFDGRSDYGAFIEVGIPAGGLFTGAEGVKSQRLAAIYGGVAGEAFDRCYHKACDNFEVTGEPLALKALDEMSDAAAHATYVLANTDKMLRTDVVPTNKYKVIEYKGHMMVS